MSRRLEERGRANTEANTEGGVRDSEKEGGVINHKRIVFKEVFQTCAHVILSDIPTILEPWRESYFLRQMGGWDIKKSEDSKIHVTTSLPTAITGAPGAEGTQSDQDKPPIR